MNIDLPMKNRSIKEFNSDIGIKSLIKECKISEAKIKMKQGLKSQ